MTGPGIRAFPAAVVLAVVCATSAAAQSPFADRKTITTAAAERIAKACVGFAEARNLKLAVVVLDNIGAAIYTYKMDGAVQIALDTAERKAKTAWTFRQPTSQLAQRFANSPNTASWMGLFPVLGGLPIMVDGQVAGAVGVGGGPPPNDESCAQAGLDAVLPKAPAAAPVR